MAADAMEASKRILIVDSDPAVHALLGTALSSSDRTLESAYSEAEALALIKTKRVDLVLADLYMSGTDEASFLKQLREERPGANVVVMSAQTQPASILNSISSQAYGYIGKPLSTTAIKDIVNSALRDTPAEDDITVLSGRAEWVTLKIRCKIAVADRLTTFFREFAADLDSEDRESISCAFRELLMNAIEHGGKADPSQFVHLTYIRTMRSLIYIIRDPGDGFSFDNLRHAAVANADGFPFDHAKVRQEMGIRPGGFGILMTRNFADELLYNDKGNEVMFVKYLGG